MFDSRNNCSAIIETASNTLIAGCKNTIIPNSITGIRRFAFRGCSGLTSITIPKSVNSIGVSAFMDCSGLVSVTVENETPVSISYSTFSNRSQATLYVPYGSSYMAALYWNEFKEIVEMPDPASGIIFADANVKALCVSKWDTNCDGAKPCCPARSPAGPC